MKNLKRKLVDTFIPVRGDSGRVLASKLLVDIAVLLVLIALVIGGMVAWKYIKAQNNIHGWQGLKPSSSDVSEPNDPSGSDGEADNIWAPSEPNLDNDYGIDPDWIEAYTANSDFLGWISIEGTDLDLPVVKGSDNAYYLDHTLEKKYDPFGVPFADFRIVLTPNDQSENITIYGHASASGSFFAPVKQYQDIEFYKEHPVVEFNTIYGKGLYKVFAFGIINADASGYYQDPTLYPEGDTFNYHDYSDMGEAEFEAFIQEVNRRSFFKTDVDIQPGDKIITLSTCDTTIINSLSTPYRNVLFARKVRPGEVMDVDVSKVEPNTEVVMPAAWVAKYGKNTPFA